MRALIIDDNTTSLMLLKQLVSRVDGCEVTTFSDPSDAVSHISELDFDLVLVDYTMPNLTGVEVIRKIRLIDKHRAVPIIMVTAESERGKRLDAFDAGATDFISKPIEPVEFKARVRNLLSLRKYEVMARDLAAQLADQIARNAKSAA